MKTKNFFFTIIAIFVMVIVCSSCGKDLVPFTTDTQKKFSNYAEDLQGYIGPKKEALVLRRILTSDTAKIYQGEVIKKNGIFYNYITIEGGTPGKIVTEDDELVGISVRKNNQELYLPLETNDDEKFILSVDKKTSPAGKNSYWITYGEDDYRIISGDYRIIGLFYIKDENTSIKHKKTKEKGWKISQKKEESEENPKDIEDE